MLNLTNIDNKVQLGLSITGYEFPEQPGDNWLMIMVTVAQAEKVFESADPALQTTDLVDLHDWFECLSSNRLPRYSRLTFIEPCLEFEFLAREESTVRIAIKLNHELKPAFNLEQFGRASENWSIVFNIGKSEFSGILKSLSLAIQQYPIRSKS